MRHFINVVLFNILVLVSILIINAAADDDQSQTKSGRVHIVYMGSASSPSTAFEHARLLTKLDKKYVVHTYNKSFLGFAARLSDEEAKSVAGRPGVVSVFPDSLSHPHTTRSWDFLTSQTAFHKTNIGPASRFNGSTRAHDDTIIGILDSGIWPQHPSFNDKGMSPIPTRWKGVCMVSGNESTPFCCNRKVIGARYYDDPDFPGSITSAADSVGHGTHVASTAAGSRVHVVSYYSLAEGAARGGSPESRIAVYSACSSNGCADSSILKAFDDAISDGVDVISISLGEPIESFYTDATTIGAFHAVEKGVVVVASAGNDGPSPGTVSNYSPWILTVAATTMDRDFRVGIVLGGANEVVEGGGINFFPILDESPVYRIVEGRSVGYDEHDLANATECMPGSLDDAKVEGNIVLCENKESVYILDKADAMIKQGVVAVIVISDSLRQRTPSFRFPVPFAAVGEAEGARLRSYIRSKRNPLATILPTEVILNHKPAPVVATFSSRGPTPGIKNLLKPDVTAPGVSVLAAWRFNDTSIAFPGKEPPVFNLASGTSMSCPHVSGQAAVVKSWNPTWTPSAIKSAIMTSAIQTNNRNAPITTFEGARATPYDIGSGEISLSGSLWPGLVYELETIDYILFLCNYGYNTSVIKIVSSTLPGNFSCPSNSSPDLISDMNYPSIAVSGLMKNVSKTMKRIVTNVGRVHSSYKVVVEAPEGVHVQVVPSKLKFTKNVKKLSFQVTFLLTAESSSSKEDLFGSITWSNTFHNVRSPFVVSNA